MRQILGQLGSSPERAEEVDFQNAEDVIAAAQQLPEDHRRHPRAAGLRRGEGRVSLSQTGMWIDSLGRSDSPGAGIAAEEFLALQSESRTPCGTVTHLAPAVRDAAALGAAQRSTRDPRGELALRLSPLVCSALGALILLSACAHPALLDDEAPPDETHGLPGLKARVVVFRDDHAIP